MHKARLVIEGDDTPDPVTGTCPDVVSREYAFCIYTCYTHGFGHLGRICHEYILISPSFRRILRYLHT